jgi:hypothetical protein
VILVVIVVDVRLLLYPPYLIYSLSGSSYLRTCRLYGSDESVRSGKEGDRRLILNVFGAFDQEQQRWLGFIRFI